MLLNRNVAVIFVIFLPFLRQRCQILCHIKKNTYLRAVKIKFLDYDAT